jgi:hypothetical protein
MSSQEIPPFQAHSIAQALIEALKQETIDLFIDFVFNYPTLSEMYKDAAYDGLGNLPGHKMRQGQRAG